MALGMESIGWEPPNVTLQEILEEINENTKFVESEVSKLLQHIKHVTERGTKRDLVHLGRTIIKRTSKKKELPRPTAKRLKAYSQMKDLDATLLKESIINNADWFKRADIEEEYQSEFGLKDESFLKLNYEDFGFKDAKCNLHTDKVPLHTVRKDPEKEFHGELVDEYMKLQTERLLYREKFKKPDTLLEAITVVDKMTDLLDMIGEMQKEELKGFKWSGEVLEQQEAPAEEEDEKLKASSTEEMLETAEKTSMASERLKSGKKTLVSEDATVEDLSETLEEDSDKEFFQTSDDEDAALSMSSEEDEEAGDAEANREAMRLLYERLKRAVDDEYCSLSQLVEEEDFTPELILQQIFFSKTALKSIDLENDCFLLFLVKNAPRLLLRSNITSPAHHRINRNGRVLIKLLFKNKLLKPMPRLKRKRNPPKWIVDDDCSISTESTDVSSNEEYFPFVEKKKLMAVQATEDLRQLSDILRVQINDKFIKATGERHELFSHYIDISNQEKLFRKACNKTTSHFPQVMYLFWKRWLLSNLQDLIFMESRGRLISKSIGSMLRMKKHFDYLESITQYGDKLHQQVIYDSVAEDYNLLSDGVYDLRKAIADLLNDIFFSCHKIDNKFEEYNTIKKEVDSIQAQIKSCNRIRRREKEKYNKIKSVLDGSKVEPKKVVFRSHDQQSPNINVYIKYKMKNNFTRHALTRLQLLARSQQHKVKSLTNAAAPVKYHYIKQKQLKGFESMLRMVKRSFDTLDPSSKVQQRKPKTRAKRKGKKGRKRRLKD